MVVNALRCAVDAARDRASQLSTDVAQGTPVDSNPHLLRRAFARMMTPYPQDRDETFDREGILSIVPEADRAQVFRFLEKPFGLDEVSAAIVEATL